MERQRTALISVFEKTGIVDFAKELIEMDWKIIASGGTAKTLTEAGLTVVDVATISGLGPILDHRVVTLVPQIHGGLLALPKHVEELKRLGISWIDLVCVDLYPLEAEIERNDSTRETVIEKTDIGGPTMLRSGAKGLRIAICDPKDRARVIRWLKLGEPDKEEFIRLLQGKVELTIAEYCLRSGLYQLSYGKKLPVDISRWLADLKEDTEVLLEGFIKPV
jgi:phosphoribosylaminoimidazolecarboxamide formyltransferase/IMP cyclohydrolase